MSSLKVIASGSRGNGYVLVAGYDILIIEAGVRAKEVLKALNFEEGIRKVRGCLVSHL